MGSRAVYEAVLIRRTLEAIGFEGFSFAPVSAFYVNWVQSGYRLIRKGCCHK